MPLHGISQLCSLGSCRQIQHPIQAEYPEKVSVSSSGGGAGAGVSYLAEVVVPLSGLERIGEAGLLGDGRRYDAARRYIPDDPVDENAGRSIRIFQDYRQGAGIIALDLYLGR